MSYGPTGRAALVAVASAALAATGLGPLHGVVAANAAVLALLAIDAVRTIAPRRLEFNRVLPGTLALGQHGELAWQLRNPAKRAVRVALADEIPPSWRCADRRARVKVPVSATVTRRRAIRPARRGRFAISQVTLRTTGPFGLVWRQATVAVPGTMRVIPAFPSRAQAELRVDRNRSLDVGLRTAKGRGGGTDFDQLRDYQVDDEYRRIDWTATARRGQPVVRTYRAERNQQILVLLDTGRTMAATVQGASRLEHCLDAVMALAVAAGRLGDRVAFSAHDSTARVDVPPLDRPERAPLLVDAMVDLQPRLVETDYQTALAQLVARFRRRSLVVVMTDLSEAVTMARLAPPLQLALRRHLVIVAAVSDPTLNEWADDNAADHDALYRKAAASRLLERRQEIADALTQRGAIVVDDTPQRLALRLVDTYLNLKTEQRL